MSEHSGHRSLVVFTSLAIAGAGLVAASAYFELMNGPACPAAVASGTVLLTAGLAVSLGHLGQKRRAGLAVRGAGRSALSNEALLAGLALAGAGVVAGLGIAGAPSPVATAAAGVISAAFLVSIGLVYRVRGQRTWQGFSAATPLSGGLAFGAVALQSLAAPGGVFSATLLFIAIDAVLFSQRWRDVVGIPHSDDMLANPWQVRRMQVLAARFLLLDVSPFFLLVVSPPLLAALVAAAGLFVDRLSFYALAVQHTTEHEVAAIEAQIGALDHPAKD